MDNQYFIFGGAATLVGFVFFRIVLSLLPGRLRASNFKQKQEIINEAKRQAVAIREDSKKRAEDKVQLLREDLEDAITEKKQEVQFLEEEFQIREKQAIDEETLLKKEAQEIDRMRSKVDRLRSKHSAIRKEIRENREELSRRLAEISKMDMDRLIHQLSDDIVDDRTLQSQKVLKDTVENLELASKRLGERMLSRMLSRYQPDFVWPKMINHVEVKDKNAIKMLQDNDQEHIKSIKDMAEIEVEFQVEEDSRFTPMIKLAGGFGLHREAARLALEDVVRNPSDQNFSRMHSFFNRHLRQLEHQAMNLGQHACNELELDDLHPEIKRLIGCLNWRTSYRQNQFHHSLEVARLAGILAFELDIDPQEAKRCGILHDIGKAIDYRIEGSHAVISGDYADRYGEEKLICDTVMSHHNDLVLETPLSYVLKTSLYITFRRLLLTRLEK